MSFRHRIAIIIIVLAAFVLVAVGASMLFAAPNAACSPDGALPGNASAGLISDCEALMDSKAALKGTNGSLNWWSGRLIDAWNGVTVRNGRVQVLDLRDRGLDGSIPERLTDLDALTDLYLGGNAFTGCIPASLRDVARNDLATLGLAFCGQSTTTSTPIPQPTATPQATPDPTPTAEPTVEIQQVLESVSCREAEIKKVLGESFTLMGPPQFTVLPSNGRGWLATHTSYWQGEGNWGENLEAPADYFICLAVLYDNVVDAYHDGGYHSLRRWLERSYDLVERKVYIPPAIGDEFVAAGYLHQRPLHPDRPEYGPVTEQAEAASRYGRGLLAIYLYADFNVPELNPALQRGAEDVALRRATQRVLEMAVEMDARISRELEAAGGPAKGLLETKGLSELDVRPRLHMR